jgi:hypothetical protein
MDEGMDTFVLIQDKHLMEEMRHLVTGIVFLVVCSHVVSLLLGGRR